jgi:hypothetical protein
MTLAVNIPRGTTHDIKVTVTAKNLAGATAVCTFVTAHGETATLVKLSSDGGITVTGATNSLVTVHLLPADAETLTGPVYLYQLRTTLSTVQEIIEEGVLTLTDNDTYGL